MNKYNYFILGGTFDHFHKGHKALIDKAFELGKTVFIGVVAQENLYKNKPLAQTIEPYEVRLKSLTDYLKNKGWLQRAKLSKLYDIYGPAVSEKNLDAVVASRITYQNTLKLNQKRAKLRWSQLKIILIPDVLAEDGKLLTSERIRGGEIDREGKIYAKIFAKTLKLPENLREKLREPLGKVIVGGENELEKTARELLHYINIMEWKPTMLVAVGDIIAMSLEQVGFHPDVKIIDFRSRRKDLMTGPVSGSKKIFPFPSTPVINNPGTISTEAVGALQKAIQNNLTTGKKQTVVIKGEEDLITLPAIMLSPLGSVVLYGQMDLGVVMVEVTEEIKTKIEKILSNFLKII